jgi:hypothetical protein
MRRIIQIVFLNLAWFQCLVVSAQSDITTPGAKISSQYPDSPDEEGISNLIDDKPDSKFLTFHNSSWIQFQTATPFIVDGYAITSANDAPDRDPKSWTLQGSNNGYSWTLLNTQSDQDFANRFQRREFKFTNNAAYSFYRLNMTNNSGNILQLGELEIFGIPGSTDVVRLYPQAKYKGTVKTLGEGDYTQQQLLDKGITAQDISSIKVVTGFQATFYERDNFNGSSLTKSADDPSLSDDRWSSRVASLKVTKYMGTVPPLTWKEHWFEHNQVLKRVYYDPDLVVYFDQDMDSSITWIKDYVGNAWRYTKQVYGNMNGADSVQRLWAIFHHNKYSGGHPAYYFDPGHDSRNVIDLGQKNSWADSSGWNLDATIHEIGHVVESVTNNAQGSPAFKLWGDSQWCVIYQYDVYQGLGWTNEAERWYNQKIKETTSYPRANTYWFRDWFYPIWNKYGKSDVLSKFFKLTSQYYPKKAKKYSRDMNWGEFVHFWSAAAGVNLKSRATMAFGWSPEYEAQFNQARKDFPVPYNDMIERDGYTLVIVNQDPSFDAGVKEKMVETFYKVYPQLVNDFNPAATRELTFIIDTAYTGVAEAANGMIRFSSAWFHKKPQDTDVVTHEVMHIIQNYRGGVPGWLTEGIADYVRFVYGVNNETGGWRLPDFKSEQNYKNSYRITARFLAWIEKNFQPGIVKTLDKAMRAGTYSPAIWVNHTGKTVDQLWASYEHNPAL